jgi:hypothetical protein
VLNHVLSERSPLAALVFAVEIMTGTPVTERYRRSHARKETQEWQERANHAVRLLSSTRLGLRHRDKFARCEATVLKLSARFRFQKQQSHPDTEIWSEHVELFPWRCNTMQRAVKNANAIG